MPRREELTEREIFDAFRQEAAEVVASNDAHLEDIEDGAGRLCLTLIPANENACSITVISDWPTLCMGPEQHCTEMFGSDETRLHDLRLCVRAVINGRYEGEHRQKRFLWRRYTQLLGTFHTETGPWRFTRQGSEPRGAVQHKTYEPYRVG